MSTALHARITHWLTETASSMAFAAMLLMLICGIQQPWTYNVAAAVYYIALTIRCGIGFYAHARRPSQWPWTWMAAWLLSTGLYGAAVVWGTDNFYVLKAAAPTLVLTAMLLVTDGLRMTLRDVLKPPRPCPCGCRPSAGRPDSDNPDS